MRSYFLLSSAAGLALSGVLACDLDTIDVPEDELDAIVDEVKDAVDVKFTMVHTRYEPSSNQFIELTPPEKKRNLFSVHELNGKLFVVGGVNEEGNYVDDLESYDPETDSWEARPSWPRPGLAATVVVGGQLCAFAGYQGVNRPLRREVDCFDPEENAWARGPDLPEAYSSAYPAVYQGRIYLFGGTDKDLRFFDSAWSYAPGDAEWRAQAPLPNGRAFMGVQTVLDKIYVIGGFSERTYDDSDNALHDRVTYVYDPATDSWETTPIMPHSRALYGLDEVDGRLAVFFGITQGPLVEFFDPESGGWVAGTDPPELPSGGVYTYVKHEDEMYLFALADAATTQRLSSSGSLYRYVPDADQWTKVAKRGSDQQDAFFYGASLGDGIDWVGASTQLSFSSPTYTPPAVAMGGAGPVSTMGGAGGN